ncbi:MAG: ABC transporter permease, partial [Rhodoferax sp.]|nr:ABC transporter permease [Rhodoferax sp.]
LRQLRKSPGFAVTAVLMLALGICANSTVFSWINATMLNPIPGASDTGNLVTIMRGAWSTSPSPPLSYPDYRDLRQMNHSFSGILAYHHEWATLTGGDTPQRIYAANITSNYFDVLGIRPFLGRFFRPDEEAQQGGVPYVVLGYELWQSRFDADPAIVGKSIEINQRPLTVIGVAPAGFIGCMTGIRTDAWAPLDVSTEPGSNSWIDRRSHDWLNVMGRLRPGVSRENATEDLSVLMRQLVVQYPEDHVGVNTITLDPLWRSPFGANIYLSASLPILLGIAGVVLLLTSANVATLALVRFVSRRREIAIRQSLGASRLALMRQMVLEGLLVSLGGGGLAILLTTWSSKSLARFIPPNANPIEINGYVDHNVIGAILVLAILSSVICGALPAWRSSRVSSAEVLKEEAASVSSGAHNRHLLSGLVVAQIALSLALLITSGLFLRTLKAASDADPGFEQAHVLTASVGLGTAGYSDDEIRAFQHKLLDKLQAMPGTVFSSLTDWLPLDFTRKTTDAYPEGYVPQLHESLEVRRADVSAGYFDTLSIPILEGRAFTRDDNENAPNVAIVDETAASRYWPGQNPLGRRLHIFGTLFTVVGVARNSKHHQVNEPPEPMVYFSLFQVGGPETTIQVRTQGDPHALAQAVEQTVHQINTRLPVFDVRPLNEATQISTMFQKIEALFASVFAVLALLLAASGIYGVVAYRAELRTHEIGIRVALGASRSDVLRLVLYQGLRLTAIGLALGLTLSLVLTRFLRGMLYGVSATDPLTVVSVTALLLAIAVLACYLPALRAMRINPVTAMREQ